MTNGTNPILAARLARYHAEDLARDAVESRRRRLARRCKELLQW